jgi:hypothetical protein
MKWALGPKKEHQHEGGSRSRRGFPLPRLHSSPLSPHGMMRLCFLARESEALVLCIGVSSSSICHVSAMLDDCSRSRPCSLPSCAVARRACACRGLLVAGKPVAFRHAALTQPVSHLLTANVYVLTVGRNSSFLQPTASFGSRSVCGARFCRFVLPFHACFPPRALSHCFIRFPHATQHVPGNASAPAQIWADGFQLLLGLANNPALPNIIYAVGKLQLNSSQSVASPAPHQNVVVEVDTRNRNTWSVVATLHNDASRAPSPLFPILTFAADGGQRFRLSPLHRLALHHLRGQL